MINWSQVSRILTGNRKQITSKYDGKKYRQPIEEIRTFEHTWLKKWNKEK